MAQKRAFAGLLLPLTFMTICYFYASQVSKVLVENRKVIVIKEVKKNHSLVVRPIYNKLVIYNRVSKCASSTMIWIAKVSSKIMGYEVNVQSSPYMSKYFNRTMQKLIARSSSLLKPNTIFIRHFFFFDFSQYGASPPVFINVIRDPVDRFISRFYYARFGFMWKKGNSKIWNKSNVSDTRMKMTLEECVLGGVENCLKQEMYMPIVSFFCDDEDVQKCQELTPSTLQRSMDNVVNHYAVVGLQEDLPNTLAMLEVVLPTYFHKATKLLEISPETNRTKSRNRTEPSAEVKSILRQALHIEVEFYEFVKTRFYNQLNELKNNNLISNIL